MSYIAGHFIYSHGMKYGNMWWWYRRYLVMMCGFQPSSGVCLRWLPAGRLAHVLQAPSLEIYRRRDLHWRKNKQGAPRQKFPAAPLIRNTLEIHSGILWHTWALWLPSGSWMSVLWRNIQEFPQDCIICFPKVIDYLQMKYGTWQSWFWFAL